MAASACEAATAFGYSLNWASPPCTSSCLPDLPDSSLEREPKRGFFTKGPLPRLLGGLGSSPEPSLEALLDAELWRVLVNECSVRDSQLVPAEPVEVEHSLSLSSSMHVPPSVTDRYADACVVVVMPFFTSRQKNFCCRPGVVSSSTYWPFLSA